MGWLMCRSNAYSLSGLRVLSSDEKLFLRQLPLAAGLAALALGLLAAPGAARAQIVVSQTAATTPWALNGGGQSTDVAYSNSQSFTITAGLTNSVLVVQFDGYQNTSAASDPTQVIWATSSGTTALTLASSANYGTGGVYPVGTQSSTADIFYLDNPTGGAGQIVINGSAHGADADAFVLTGVNTSIAPASYANSGNSSSLYVTDSTATANQFAFLNGGSHTTGPTYSTTQSSTVTAYPGNFAKTDPNGGVASTSSYFTIPSTASIRIGEVGAAGSRNAFAVAIFTAAPNNVWSGNGGSAGNATWDLTTGNNWLDLGAAQAYTDYALTVFNDTGINTNINLTSAATIDPGGVTFQNNTKSYTFTQSGGGTGISGSTSVALTGTGTVTFNLGNSYTGGTTIRAGTLVAGNNSALGTLGVSMGTGAVGLITNGANTIGNAITVTGGTATLGTTVGSGTSTFSSLALSGSGPVTFSAHGGRHGLVQRHHGIGNRRGDRPRVQSRHHRQRQFRRARPWSRAEA